MGITVFFFGYRFELSLSQRSFSSKWMATTLVTWHPVSLTSPLWPHPIEIIVSGVAPIE